MGSILRTLVGSNIRAERTRRCWSQTDLAAALGHLGNPKHPEVLAAIDDAIARVKACGKPAGILTGDPQLAQHYLDLGGLFVAVGADQNILRDSAEALLRRFKA